MAAAESKLTVGYFTLPPDAMADKGRPHGIAIDYFKEHIAPQLGVDVELVALPFLRAMKFLERGKIDAVLLLGYNEARARKFVYAAQPFDSLECGLVTAAGSPITGAEPMDRLMGHKIRLNSRFVGIVVESLSIRFGSQRDGSRALSGLVLACR